MSDAAVRRPAPPLRPAKDAGGADGAASTGGFSAFLQLERQARQAEDRQALGYVIVNETKRLIPYRQAALLRPRGRGWRVVAISSVPAVERNAPMVRWLADTVGAIARGPERLKSRSLGAEDLPSHLAKDWEEWVGGAGHYVPLPGRDGQPIAALWLGRSEPLPEGQQLLLDRLAEAYGHALAALEGNRPRKAAPWRARLLAASVLAALVAVAFIPIEQSALAPARVAPANPAVVAAPMMGVIESVAVSPNEVVEAGDLLFRMDETEVAARRDVAERTLEVARAELRRAGQQAFSDREGAAQVAILEAQVDLRAAELAYAEALLRRVAVTAPRAGVAVFADADDWIGRPVSTGERVMRIADPATVQVAADLPVADAIAVDPGARVRLFLDVDPLNPLPAVLTRTAYEAEVTEAGPLAYPVEARFADGVTPPRVGLTGTAVIYGEPVRLWFYLLRRPIAAIRQTLGL